MRMEIVVHRVHPCFPARKFLKDKSITQAWNECKYGAWMLWALTRLKPRGKSCWYNTPEYKRANKALRDRSIPGTPAERIRTVVTGRQVAILAGKYLERFKNDAR